MRIRLIGSVNIPPIVGHDGHIIEVTAENQDLAESLVLCGSARTLKDTTDTVVLTDSGAGPQLEKLSRDQLPEGVLKASQATPLSADSPVADLATLGIHGRYIKALTDAGAKTLGDVRDKSAQLAEVPGISNAAAETIAKALRDALPPVVAGPPVAVGDGQ